VNGFGVHPTQQVLTGMPVERTRIAFLDVFRAPEPKPSGCHIKIDFSGIMGDQKV